MADMKRTPDPVALHPANSPRLADAAPLSLGFLPGPALSRAAPVKQALEVISDEYVDRVERLAEQLRPRFERGELHGFDSTDCELDVAALAGRVADHLPPFFALCDGIQEAMVRSFADAWLILACSPSERLMDGGFLMENATAAAAQCLAYDVLRIARQRGWYVPGPEELPCREQLGA